MDAAVTHDCLGLAKKVGLVTLCAHKVQILMRLRAGSVMQVIYHVYGEAELKPLLESANADVAKEKEAEA